MLCSANNGKFLNVCYICQMITYTISSSTAWEIFPTVSQKFEDPAEGEDTLVAKIQEIIRPSQYWIPCLGGWNSVSCVRLHRKSKNHPNWVLFGERNFIVCSLSLSLRLRANTAPKQWPRNSLQSGSYLSCLTSFIWCFRISGSWCCFYGPLPTSRPKRGDHRAKVGSCHCGRHWFGKDYTISP